MSIVLGWLVPNSNISFVSVCNVFRAWWFMLVTVLNISNYVSWQKAVCFWCVSEFLALVLNAITELTLLRSFIRWLRCVWCVYDRCACRKHVRGVHAPVTSSARCMHVQGNYVPVSWCVWCNPEDMSSCMPVKKLSVSVSLSPKVQRPLGRQRGLTGSARCVII